MQVLTTGERLNVLKVAAFIGVIYVFVCSDRIEVGPRRSVSIHLRSRAS